MSKFVNIARIRERVAEMAEHICQEEGLEVKVDVKVAQTTKGRELSIEIVEQPHRQPKEIVN